jgi:peptidoglycan L-alanyl-D-glutamate endopeptidase CwlK
MPHYSDISLERLVTCDIRLQKLFLRVIEEVDCSILCGHRTESQQRLAFEAGTSMLTWPESQHNKVPSRAIDVIPYPIDWEDVQRIARFGWFVKGMAAGLDIQIVWGGDWKSFLDYPHYELRS